MKPLLSGIAGCPAFWFRTILAHRSVLRKFIAKDLRGRYAGSAAGLLWAVITPISQIAIYAFLFTLIFRVRLPAVETGTESFVIYMLAGLFPWLAFSEGLQRAAGVLLENANLITKVSFAVELLPTTAVTSAYILNGLGFLLVLAGFAFAGLASWSWLLLPFLTGLLWLFTLGLAAFLSALCVFLRDAQQLLGIVIFVWFYLTPILYPLSMVPAEIHGYLKLNPLFAFIESYHQIILMHTLRLDLLSAAILWTVLSVVPGCFFFTRMKPSFADVI